MGINGFFIGTVLQCFLLGMLVAGTSEAQNTVQSVREAQLSLNLKNASLEECFRLVENLTEYRFTYDRRIIDRKVKVTLQSGTQTVSDILLELSRQAGLSFKQINNTINVQEATKGSNQAIVEVNLQGITVTGRVTSEEDDEGIPGVNVIVKGTSQGTVSDIDGRYRIDVPSTESILVYSSVGFIFEEVTVGNRSVIDLSMTPDLQQLDEIVVIGYGEVKKSDLTGSVATLKGETFREQPVNSLDEALQGRMAGVLVGSSTGPGGVVDIKIRGASSITSGIEPLYVIDGIPQDNNSLGAVENGGDFNDKSGAVNVMATINPADIKSIEVLKDASATAIYGSRGSNGVILITTKTGSVGKLKVDVDYMYGLKKADKVYDLMDTQEYLELVDVYETYKNQAGTYAPFAYGFESYRQIEGGDSVGVPYNTDWQNEILQVAEQHNLNVNLSGGSELVRYNVSANYLMNEGLFRESFFNRGSVRFNIDFQLSERAKITTKLTASESSSAYASSRGVQRGINMRYALEASPTFPIRDASGRFTQTSALSSLDTYNPVGVLEGVQQDNQTLRVLGNAAFEYELTDWLTYKLLTGYDLVDDSRRNYQASDAFKGVSNQGMAFTTASSMATTWA